MKSQMEIPNELYRMRTLSSELDFHRVKEIFEKEQFWCSSIWELNDPMEGVYWFNKSPHNEDRSRVTFAEKNKRVICSFMGKEALKYPQLWGYYTNGFRGIAIGVKPVKDFFEPIKYKPHLAREEKERVDDIQILSYLTTKLNNWEIENEFRFIRPSEEKTRPFYTVGDIVELVVGLPIADLHNHHDIVKKSSWKEYYKNIICLIEYVDTFAKYSELLYKIAKYEDCDVSINIIAKSDILKICSDALKTD